MGLIGSDGIMPAAEFVNAMADVGTQTRWWQNPTLFWFIEPSDLTIHALCLCATILSIALILGFLPRLVLVGLWTLYLSFFSVGQPFLGYQWDILLLEIGFLSIFLAPGRITPNLKLEREPSPYIVWLFRLILFKLVISSGLVKLNSGDPTWQDLTALDFHFWTQPIPHQLAWYAHQMGPEFRQLGVAFNHYVELCVPWLILLPISRFSLLPWIGVTASLLWLSLGSITVSLIVWIGVGTGALYALEHWLCARKSWVPDSGRSSRTMAFILITGLMASVGLSGNYGFFNLLTVAIALLCLDDRLLYRLMPASKLQLIPNELGQRSTVVWSAIAITLLCVMVPLNSLRLLRVFAPNLTTSQPKDKEQSPSKGVSAIAGAVESLEQTASHYFGPFVLSNGYGLFARMTTERYELKVEASHDGQEWKAYTFEYKPNHPNDLNFAWLHMPRLDWQMWFAALYPQCRQRWFFSFLDKLLDGSKPVLSLLDDSPFDTEGPKVIRVSRDKYQFGGEGSQSQPGEYWTSDPVSPYCPPLTAAQLKRMLQPRR